MSASVNDSDAGPQESSTRRRNYQACLECKKHKVKCRLGNSENPQPPCVRCCRARVACVFGPARKLKPRANPRATLHVAAHDDGSQNEHPELEGSTDDPRNADASGSPSEPMRPTEHTPTPDDPRPTEPSHQNLSRWTQFNLCRDGYLTPREAEHLLDYFFRWMHPLYPLVDHRFSDVASWGQLMGEDSLLCTTILVITSRYTWHQTGSFSSKAIEVHSAIYKYLQLQIQRCLWAADPERHSEARSLSLIESIMLIVEFHPRSLDLVATPKDITGSYALESFGYTPTPCAMEPSSLEAEVRHAWDDFKPLNTTSWRLLCMAVNLADELGLHQVITIGYENSHGGDTTRRAHVREFLVCLVWERCYRLGRRCLIDHPSDAWKPTQDLAVRHPWSDLLESRAELYRLIRLIENTLYASARHTESILASGNYKSSINDFSGLLAAWRTRFDRVKKSSPPFSKLLDMTWHHTRVFLYSIGLKAFATTCKKSASSSFPLEATGNCSMSRPSHITQANQVCQNRDMVREMITDSEQIIRLALELHWDGMLGHVPLNILYHTASASMVLLRVQHLHLSTRTDLMDLLNQVVQALEDSSVDDAYASFRFASLLKKMIQKVEKDRTRSPSHMRCPIQASESGEGMVGALEPESYTMPPAHEISNVGNSSTQRPCKAFGGSLQDQLLSFEFDDEWARWLNS